MEKILNLLKEHRAGLTARELTLKTGEPCGVSCANLVKCNRIQKHYADDGTIVYTLDAAQQPSLLEPEFPPTAQTAIDSVSAIIDENTRLRAALAEMQTVIGRLL